MDPQAGGLLGRDGPADRRGARQRLAQGLARQLEGRGADEGCAVLLNCYFFRSAYWVAVSGDLRGRMMRLLSLPALSLWLCLKVLHLGLRFGMELERSLVSFLIFVREEL